MQVKKWELTGIVRRTFRWAQGGDPDLGLCCVIIAIMNAGASDKITCCTAYLGQLMNVVYMIRRRRMTIKKKHGSRKCT
jgi:hypothetical protein